MRFGVVTRPGMDFLFVGEVKEKDGKVVGLSTHNPGSIMFFRYIPIGDEESGFLFDRITPEQVKIFNTYKEALQFKTKYQNLK